jgi:hypothetical protein
MPIYITETGIADRSDKHRALMINKYMEAVSVSTGGLTACSYVKLLSSTAALSAWHSSRDAVVKAASTPCLLVAPTLPPVPSPTQPIPSILCHLSAHPPLPIPDV